MFLFGSVYIPIMIIMSQAAECTRYAWSKTYLQRVGHEQHRICVHPHVTAVSSNGKGPVRPRVKAVKGRFVGFQDVRFQQTLPESCLTDLVQARFIQRLIENLKYKTLETLIFENQQSRCGCMDTGSSAWDSDSYCKHWLFCRGVSEVVWPSLLSLFQCRNQAESGQMTLPNLPRPCSGRLLSLMKKLARLNIRSSKHVMEQLKRMSSSIAQARSVDWDLVVTSKTGDHVWLFIIANVMVMEW